MAFARAEHQQDGGAAGRPRAEERSEHAAGGDRRAQRLAVEPLAGQIGDRHRHPAQQPVGVGLAERAELPPGLSAARSGRRALGSSIDGGGAARRARSTPLIRAKLVRKRGYWSASFAENARICFAARVGVVPEHERAAVQRRRARVGSRADDPQPMLHEPERAHDRRIDRRRVRERRAAEPRRDLARPRAAADAVAAFEDERLQARAWRSSAAVTSAVEPAADDDDVASLMVRGSSRDVRSRIIVVQATE